MDFLVYHLIQHFKKLEEDETLKRIDDAYNRGWYDAMNNPEVIDTPHG